ncbi:MAG: hypothetical protein IT538_02180 [Variibacter sp.]|nr:hypothetical protein [Variibacter sp.]
MRPAIGVLAALVLTVSAALAVEFKPFAREKVTEAQWTAYHDEVKAAFGASAQEVKEVNLVTYSGQGVSFAFTRPAHPAHPAWISRRITEKDGQMFIEQIGYFAGPEAPFAELFRQYQALNQRMMEEMKRRQAR